MQKALGVKISNIASLLGYYSFVLVYIVLIGSVQGCNLGLNILSKEERDKTAEFLLVKPVKRSKLVALKLGTAFILAIIVSLTVFVASQIIVGSSSEPFHLYFWEVAKLSLDYYLIEIVF